jgi:hypothetical protein
VGGRTTLRSAQPLRLAPDNQDGAADLAEIEEYVAILSTVDTPQLVVISTVCIYPGRTSPDETTPLTSDGLTPYGANRLAMEQTLSKRFDTLAVRLPQLLRARPQEGDRVRPVEQLPGRIHPTRGQVPVLRPAPALGRHPGSAWAGLNIATPALASARVAAECFGLDIADQVVAGAESPHAQMYTRDMRTIHADLYDGPPAICWMRPLSCAPCEGSSWRLGVRVRCQAGLSEPPRIPIPRKSS